MLKAKLVTWSVPFIYSLQTRFKPVQDRVSWALIQYVPILFLAATAGSGQGAFARLALALIAIVFWQVLYEIGYIHNDVVTTKSEKLPTLRLSSDLLSFGRRRLWAITNTRIITSVLLYVALAALARALPVEVNLAEFTASVLVTTVAFVVHNGTRGTWNILTYSVLASGRYASIPILIAPEGRIFAYAAIAMLMVPVVRTLEHACKPKYGMVRLQQLLEPFAKSRVIYYLIASVGYFLAATSFDLPMIPGLVLPYMLVYRLAVLGAVSRGVVRPTKHDAYRGRG